MSKFTAFGCALAVLAFAAGQACATENGTQHYPIGVNTVEDGALPPPGMLQLLNYFQGSTDPVITDGAGHKALPKFDLGAEADAPRLLYTWPMMIGPFHYTTGLVQPFVHLNLDVMGEKNHDYDLGDADIQNYLGYASPDHRLFYYFGLDVYVPTGHYRQKDLINTGSNYYTFAPNANVTWKPTRQWDFDATFFTEFNTTNTSDKYHSGDDIDLDYGITYRPLANVPQFGLGVNGFFYKQVSDDTQNDLTVATNGYRGQEFAVGPQFRYDIPFGGFVLKYQHDFDVKNRPRGEKLWLEFATPIFGTPKEPAHPAL
jgi:hypothetical protein